MAINPYSFDEAVNYLLKNEGGLNDNPHDPGGITNYGISFRFLKSIPLDRLKKYGIFSHEKEEIINLNSEKAKAIYKGEFWDHAIFNNITNQDCCNYIFDMAVNMGMGPAIKCAQRACWSVMNKRGIINDDGLLGNETISLINQCGKYLLPSMRSERAGYYRSLSENNKEFLNGWLIRAYG